MIVKSYPKILGQVELKPSEFCYVQYLPIKIDGSDIRIPESLKWVKPLLVISGNLKEFPYIYLTVKNMWVKSAEDMNRPGWHIDGFMTEDVNVIWCNKAPTQFLEGECNLPEDHTESMKEMERQSFLMDFCQPPSKTIIMLDNQCIHRVSGNVINDYRAFVKLSFSKEIYALKGNAHNHLFDYNWQMKDRAKERNCPIKGA